MRGHLGPFGDFESRPAKERVLLVGDAAGLLEPVTGEGISLAMESGLLAGAAIRDALAGGTPSDAAKAFCASVRERLHPLLKHARLARNLLYPRPLLPFAMRALRRRQELVELFLDLLSGKVTYPQYFRHVFFGHFRRLPR